MTATAAAFQVPACQRQLFLDHEGVAQCEHLVPTLHRPDKRGAVIQPDRPWESALQTRSAPAWDEEAQTYKIWMITSTTLPGVAGTTYAQSEDGVHWTKPVLRQMDVGGSSENNFVTVDPQLGWPANAIENVVRDPDDGDPARRYKGLGHCFGREPLVSRDGIHWRRLDVPTLRSEDESNLSYDRSTRRFIATLKRGGPWGRSVYLATSPDFETWGEPELVFHADETDQRLGRERIGRRLADASLRRPEYDTPEHYNVDVCNMGVFRYEGLYVGLPSMFHQTGKVTRDWKGFDDMSLPSHVLEQVRQHGDWTGFHHVQLACSRNLRHWTRVGDRQPFIDASPLGVGAYDLQCIIGPSCPVLRRDELWFYYTGARHYAYVSADDVRHAAVCLAVLRRDGFVSLDAGDREGVLTTRPFALSGDRLHVNADLSHGELRVAVLAGPGGEVAVSCPMRGDLLAGKVHWTGGGLAALVDRTVSLRFRLRRGRLYSYWLEPTKEMPA